MEETYIISFCCNKIPHANTEVILELQKVV